MKKAISTNTDQELSYEQVVKLIRTTNTQYSINKIKLRKLVDEFKTLIDSKRVKHKDFKSKRAEINEVADQWEKGYQEYGYWFDKLTELNAQRIASGIVAKDPKNPPMTRLRKVGKPIEVFPEDYVEDMDAIVKPANRSPQIDS